MRFISCFILFLLIVSGSFSSGNHQSVNVLIGDRGFEAIKGRSFTSFDDEQDRIQYHLLYVEHLLRQRSQKGLTKTEKARRNHLLDLLHTYALEKSYPVNTKYIEERKPCFIGDNGNICAVGYLVQETAGFEAAEKINAEYQYAFISEMKSDWLLDWAKENGITEEECAMIQPTYNHPIRVTRTPVLTLQVGPSYRHVPSVYPRLDLVFSYQAFKKRKRRAYIGAQYVNFGGEDYSVSLRYLIAAFGRGAFSPYFGMGGERFQIDNEDGYNLSPEFGISYNNWKGRFTFRTELGYAYKIGLTNRAAYTNLRNEVVFNIGFGYLFPSKR